MSNYKFLLMSVFMAACSPMIMPGKIEKSTAEKKTALNAKIKITDHNYDNRQNDMSNTSALYSGANKDNCHRSALLSASPDKRKVNNTYATICKAYADSIEQTPRIYDTAINQSDSFIGSVNFNLRKPNFVIIHHTGQKDVEETFRTFALSRTQASAQYIIGRDGKVYHVVNDYLRAWQAGAGKWGNITDMNSCSIGIELDNNGFEPFSTPQINSLLILLNDLKQHFNIPTANFIGHEDYAPSRKNDPSVYFPWHLLAQHGFGLWWSDTTGVKVPLDFKPIEALRIIGYDVDNPTKAIVAFRRHFCSIESERPSLSPGEIRILYKLYPQYM